MFDEFLWQRTGNLYLSYKMFKILSLSVNIFFVAFLCFWGYGILYKEKLQRQYIFHNSQHRGILRTASKTDI